MWVVWAFAGLVKYAEVFLIVQETFEAVSPAQEKINNTAYNSHVSSYVVKT